MDSETILCPSARCEDGAILVGIVMSDGRVAFTSGRMEINEEFVQIAHRGRSPEKRFRFANTCVKGACQQWSGSRCGIIDAVMEAVRPAGETSELPACSIRSQCRWFDQSGAAACAVCPEVITDTRADASVEAASTAVAV
ncbi:MAG TPA: hypothetical protein VEY11_07510 [Pyrinomonadaceae bacterium]|nr:hypothetical protein [Pyrinomonadaceae bacterium]